MARRLQVDPINPAPAVIQEAAKTIQEGGLLVLPTDTAYGLSGNPHDASVVERILALKKRTSKPGMPLLAMSLDQVRTLVSLTKLAETLATHFWPGGLTIILPAQQSFPPGILGPNNSLAIRIPDHTVALAIIQAVDSPIIGTSANISDYPSPRTADAATAYLEQQVDLIIDGGPTLHQADSTIIDCTQKHPKILRRGAVDSEKLRQYLQS